MPTWCACSAASMSALAGLNEHSVNAAAMAGGHDAPHCRAHLPGWLSPFTLRLVALLPLRQVSPVLLLDCRPGHLWAVRGWLRRAADPAAPGRRQRPLSAPPELTSARSAGRSPAPRAG